MSFLSFTAYLCILKHLKRTGWVIRNVNDCETISGHMYRMGLMTFLLGSENELNRTKCMELGREYVIFFFKLILFCFNCVYDVALVHDLAESVVGDITPLCGISREEKQRRELEAMHEISNLIAPQGERLMELFEVR